MRKAIERAIETIELSDAGVANILRASVTTGYHRSYAADHEFDAPASEFNAPAQNQG